ncbi:MAG: hypothetical protein AAGI03_17940 [Pseudomonadota bacterium]
MTKATLKEHRHAREPHNWYVEPFWVSRRLFEVERFEGAVVDPCAGWGRVLDGAQGAGLRTWGYDIVDRDAQQRVTIADFFVPLVYHPWPVDNIVSNPPYGTGADGERLEEQFLRLALNRATTKVAVFLPSSWSNAEKRARWLHTLPWLAKLECAPRPSCPPGHELARDEDGSGGGIDYAWYIFLRGYDGPVRLGTLFREGVA